MQLNTLSNCWEVPKLTKPQRNDEISVNVMVTKVERISWMAHG